ncbi:MAG: hypothetical protein ACPGVN_02165, partial [Alphaproteobacteria bacterium]
EIKKLISELDPSIYYKTPKVKDASADDDAEAQDQKPESGPKKRHFHGKQQNKFSTSPKPKSKVQRPKATDGRGNLRPGVPRPKSNKPR